MKITTWMSHHLSRIHFRKKEYSLLPDQEKLLPRPITSVEKGKGQDIWRVLTAEKIRVDGNRMIGISPGTAWVLVYRKAYHRRAIGLLRVKILEKPVFFRHPVVTHALGGLENQYTYCNALEGLEQSLKKGFTFLETDMILTRDRRLVCSHGWKKKTYLQTGVEWPGRRQAVMTYDTFLQTRIQGKFTTIGAEKIAEVMKEHSDLLFELDLRTLEQDEAKKTARKLVEVFDHREDLLSRLLIQVGSPEMYAGIHSVYHFPNYQYFVHKTETEDIQPVLDFCKAKRILSLALRYDYLTEEILHLAKKQGLCVLVYTVDDQAEAEKYLAMGVDTICSNFLPPKLQ